MSMKKILFVIDNLSTGGVNSSLSAVYSHINKIYNIKVFALTHDGYSNTHHEFDNAIIPRNRIVDAYQCEISRSSSFIDKSFKSLIKLIKRIALLFKIDLRRMIFRRISSGIEADYIFDYVIAFQEGPSTEFAKYFTRGAKIAWIHSDYTKSHPDSIAAEYNTFEKLVFVSKYTLSQFKHKYPDIAKPLFSIHNYIDYNRIDILSKEDIDDARFNNSDFTIISIGRIVPLKQFSKIPMIARKLLDKGMVFHWYILGPICDKTEYVTLENNILAYNCNDVVVCLDNKANPYPYLRASNVFVSLSTTEACPMVFNEARLLKVPICTNNFGSANEFIDHERNGLIGTIENLADLIFRLFIDERLRDRIINSNFNCIDNNEEITRSIKYILDQYES